MKAITGSREYVHLIFEKGAEIDHGYGVKTIELKLHGRPTGYKAVFNNDKFVAIVGSRYYVLPNPKAFKIVAPILEENGFKIVWKDENLARLWVRAERSDGYGVLVRNAIDGSSALRLYITVPAKHFRGKIIIARVYAKHFEKSIENIIKSLREFFKNDFLELVNELETKLDRLEKVELTKEYLEMLEEKLPKKYVAGAKYIGYKYKNPRAVLEYVAKNIWYARVDDDYKINLFRKLLEITQIAYTFFTL